MSRVLGWAGRPRSNEARRRKLERRGQEAGRRFWTHLDSEEIVRAAVEAAHRALRPRWASFWVTTGRGDPRLARSRGHRTLEGFDPPREILLAIRRGRPVAREHGLAAPVRAPRSGLLGILHVDGRPWHPEERRFLEAIAGEAGLALETSNLYERAVAAKEKSEAILARVGDGVVVTDLRGEILEWNQAAEWVLGRDARAAVGGRCTEVLGLHAGERRLECSQECALLRASEETEAASDRQVWRLREDGRRQPLLVNVAVVRDRDGGVSEIVHSFRDITRLKEADEAKTMFLATASHELRTPLTVIQGFAETLLDHPDAEGEKRDEALEAIARRATQFNSIVERMLLSSRIEAGRVHVLPAAIDVRPILSEVAEPLAAVTGREIVLAFDDDLPEAFADPDATSTILGHLLDNAIKYSPGGEAIFVSARSDEHSVLLSVADSGIGMDAEQAKRCFDKFWQAESSDVRRFGGTGIGLYIVRSLVEALDGEVGVETSPGEGSTFFVSLPRVGAVPLVPAAVDTAHAGGEPSVIREFMRQIGIPTRSR